ncbi:hypothetical protein [Flavilitoribacter nigricans]|uniref:Uncharacterized protein n=1 Tax=Flavilitoribacter nigricans (strain ATCC 23147 / DSM 23189 / NBRC 102662 / NCIMB 1420 / SS-2) TaxID=1122177 RepID=A0A2D0NEA3_FLAN2|nr:hypothetical protein [Flavilitoribacter nigricans]PHN06103.1 hypothetical protein CRP01_14140 [Flavilitoribacter nigricans DSM 23189 = NBRC 102662]
MLNFSILTNRFSFLKSLGLFLILTGLVASCEKQQVIPRDAPDEELTERQGLPSSATVIFGDENAGSPFPPGSGHDQSYHAKDKLVPRTVVIAAGGVVHYEMAPFHQAAIYEPGTQPQDIDTSLTEDITFPFFIPDFIINDPGGRIALSPPLPLEPITWTTPPGTFDTPGRYLVICTTTPHFVLADMYGWVIVK